MYAQTNQLISEKIGANMKFPPPSDAAPIPAAVLDSITTIAADKVAFLSFLTSLKTSGSILTERIILLKNNEIILIYSLICFINKLLSFKKLFIVYNVKKKIKMKKLEPLFNGLSAAFVISVLAVLTFESSIGVWLMFSFGSSALIVFVFHESEFAKAKNVFFGHLLCVSVGIFFNQYFGLSFASLGLSVGLCVTLMMYLKIVHPPAAANPLIALFADVSYDFILFPVVSGSIVIIVLSSFINRSILQRKSNSKKQSKNLKRKRK